MPIYEYQCQSCNHQLETLQKMSDAPLTDCPACGEPRLKKRISAAAFRLSGGGWYETDFKSGNKKNLAGDSAAGSDSSGNSAAAANGGGNSGSTPAAGESKPKAAKPESSTAA